MHKIKNMLGAAGASLVLVMSMAGVAAADATASNSCDATKGGDTACASTATDNSTTKSYTVNGNCSGIIQTSADQSNGNSTDQDQFAANNGLNVNLGKDDSNSNSNTQTQSNSTDQSNSNSVVFSPNCSTTRVIQNRQVTLAAASRPAASTSSTSASGSAAQVQVPSGGVSAGEGGGSSSPIAPLAAFVGSLGTLGFGVLRLRKYGLSA